MFVIKEKRKNRFLARQIGRGRSARSKVSYWTGNYTQQQQQQQHGADVYSHPQVVPNYHFFVRFKS